jgi:hypothetical protein
MPLSARVTTRSPLPARRPRWEQTLHEVTLYAPLPGGARLADVSVTLTDRALRLSLRGAAAPVIDAPWHAPVRAAEAVWNIEAADAARAARGGAPPPGCGVAAGEPAPRLFCAVLDKAAPGWWRAALAGGPQIDATLVDSTQPVDAYDAETQAAIRKLLHEQSEKARAGAGAGGGPPAAELAALAALSVAGGAPGGDSGAR